jgi:hypothetical protein
LVTVFAAVDNAKSSVTKSNFIVFRQPSGTVIWSSVLKTFDHWQYLVK